MVDIVSAPEAPASTVPPDPTTTITVDMDRAPPAPMTPEISTITWTNRRRMAWVSLVAMFFTMTACIFYLPIDRLEKLDSIMSNFLWAMFCVVAVYMGTTTIPFVWRGK